MKFSEDASAKRQKFARLSKALKYRILKEKDTDERGKRQMRHKPYQCDMGGK